MDGSMSVVRGTTEGMASSSARVGYVGNLNQEQLGTMLGNWECSAAHRDTTAMTGTKTKPATIIQ